VAEQNRELVQDLRKQGINAVSGDAADPSVLIQAHITDAAMLVIAIPDLLYVRQMIDTARTLNPEIEIVLHSRNEDETELLREDEAGTVFFSEEELAKNMTYHILQRFDAKSGTTEKKSQGNSE
jgi:CPA2 family monovalent cation:H+ antiporter-2